MSGGTLLERVRAARAAGDPAGLSPEPSFAAFLGIRWSLDHRGDLLAVLPGEPRLIGNPAVPALHGGAIAALLETAAIAQVCWDDPPEVLPDPVTLTFDYLRPARPAELWASARVVRRGRRVCTVRAEAWQDHRGRLVAAANVTLVLGEGPRGS